VSSATFQLEQGAVFAPDGIPLHYGDLAGEYQSALTAAVLMDRSHEGRLLLRGGDRLALIHRISTNDVEKLPEHEGKPTIFTSPIGRVIDRITIYNTGETALVLTDPGRGQAVSNMIRRNIFFNDNLQIEDIAPTTRQFVIAGAKADAVIAEFTSDAVNTSALSSHQVTLENDQVMLSRVTPVAKSQWSLIAAESAAERVWRALLQIGNAQGLRAAGSLAYNALRVRSGRPAAGHELSSEYIPLEIGLWDEVSFTKGCYTGQEIIARMESRGKLARTIIQLELERPVEANTPLHLEGREIGMLTSCAAAPDGINYGIGVVKTAAAQPGLTLTANEAAAKIKGLAGVQPAAEH